MHSFIGLIWFCLLTLLSNTTLTLIPSTQRTWTLVFLTIVAHYRDTARPKQRLFDERTPLQLGWLPSTTVVDQILRNPNVY